MKKKLDNTVKDFSLFTGEFMYSEAEMLVEILFFLSFPSMILSCFIVAQVASHTRWQAVFACALSCLQFVSEMNVFRRFMRLIVLLALLTPMTSPV